MSQEVANEVVRELAEYEARAAAETRIKLIDEHGAAYRWLIASLFAVNGGGILMIMGNSRLDPKAFIYPLILYFLGLAAAFGCAFVGQRADQKMIAQIHSWGLHWTRVGALGELDPDRESEIKKAIRAAEETGRRAMLIGWCSMLLFCSASVLLGAKL